MHTLKLYQIAHEFHYPDVHEYTAQIRHVLSSEFFWAVFALVALMCTLVMLAIFAGSSAIEYPEALPDMYLFPYYA
jgi:hypothetical protein